MATHTYWSEREGRGPKATPLTFDQLRDLVFQLFDVFLESDYTCEAFGQWCGDAPDEWIRGKEFMDLPATLRVETGRDGIWPYREHADSYDLDALFDVIEFLHGHVSHPLDGDSHSFHRHRHWDLFDADEGRKVFRDRMNGVLRQADPPVVLDENGMIHLRPDDGFGQMIDAEVPASAPLPVRERMESAVRDFRKARTDDDLRHAVRDLADALEMVRKDVKVVLGTEDEKALFETFNKFGIRHLKDNQRLDYAKKPFLRWLFYVSLATIHLTLRGGTRDPS